MRIPLDFNYTADLIQTQIGQIGSIPIDAFAKHDWVLESTRQKWLDNYLQNKKLGLDRFERCLDGVNKVIIMVGASPALNHNIHHLKDIDDNFIVICTNTTVQRLVKEGIRIDYVFMVEGEDHIQDDFDGIDTSRLVLVHSPFTSHKALRKWNGRRFLYLTGGGEPLDSVLNEDYPDVEFDIAGGNALSTGLCWAYKYLWARDFIFCGMSFCYAEDYYHDKRQKMEVFSGYKEWYYAMDIHGKLVNTTIPLTMYKTWLEAFTKMAKGNFINCTEDGIFGVLPEPIEHDGLKVRFRPKYIPWISIAPLGLTISAYKSMIHDKKEQENERND